MKEHKQEEVITEGNLEYDVVEGWYAEALYKGLANITNKMAKLIH